MNEWKPFRASEAAESAWSADVAAATLTRVLDEDVRARTSSPAEYVPVIFANGCELALRLRSALQARGIPTLVELQGRDPAGLGLLSRRIPVLVPEELQDDASAIVARLEHQPLDSFGDDDDDVFDDDDDDDFDDDLDDPDEDVFDEDEEDDDL